MVVATHAGSRSGPLHYRQSGQHPVDATFVAAAAAVPNIATRAAARPTSFIFIVFSIELTADPSAVTKTLRPRAGLRVKPLTFKSS